MSQPALRLALAPPAGQGRALPFPETGALIVGSDATSATLVLAGADVRPAHAAIAKLKGGGFGVVAVEGAPLSVNGQRVQSARLVEGDTLEVGGHVLRVVAERPAGTVRLPERLAGFRVLRRLGSGAMGQVYLALQESLAREVALKVLRPELAADAGFVRRFEAEARAAAALGHPNVVTVYDVGQAPGPDGAPIHYLAMEYMARGSLEERLVREGPLPARDVLAVLRDAARGLEYAEVRGLVHRDLKPANLMQDASGVVKIADLGLATQAEADPESRIFGTAHFASPEQVRGARLDTRSDLYSLGASAYRLLSGHTPFQGATQREILQQVLEQPPRPLAGFAPEAPAELVALIERLLAKEPDARAPNAAALAREVDSLVLRFDHGALAPLARSGGRRTVFALAALLVAGGVAWWAFGRPEADVPDVPRDGRTPSEQTAERAGERDPLEFETGDAPEEADTQPLGTEDAALRAVERDAEDALSRAAALSDPAERTEALSNVVARFAGTSAAAQAESLLAPTAPATSGSVDAEAALAAARAPLISAVERAFAPRSDERPATATDVETALRAVAVPPALLADSTFASALLRAAADWTASAERFVAARFEEADAALERGDFGAYRTALEEFLDWSAPAEALPEGAAPAGPPLPAASVTPLARLTELSRTPREALQLDARRKRAHAALARQEALEAAHEAAMAQSDRERTGRSIGAAGALAADLAALDLASAAARLESAAEVAVSQAEQAALRAQAARLRAGLDAFAALRATHGKGEWRRRNVPMPGRRTLMAEVVRFDAQGMHVLAGGEESYVAWRDFAGRSQEVSQLFGQRLSREWTRDEARQIAVVATVAALGEFLRHALGVLDPSTQLRLSPGEFEELRLTFERAGEWAAAGGVEDWFAAERRAALRVARALRALDERDPLVVAWALERAVAEGPDTLVVRALSDGRPQSERLPWPPADHRPLAGPLEATDAPDPDAAPDTAPDAPPAAPPSEAPTPPDDGAAGSDASAPAGGGPK